MDTVERRLKCPYGYLQNDPPYETPDDHLGRLTYFQKAFMRTAPYIITALCSKSLQIAVSEEGRRPGKR